ncbi:hypothetical protein PHYSODRAFT_516690 [Phytophthora sojae]|uniref:ATP-dependent DNA helicase n=1 Tax=Phytophthora sojae (strain P6497) TaxID=1094619 RepID=G4ZVK3_PHYSP|nr:hypothetical protein PHYSODRAFT_516690 [Phytophthora sojae]EGZ12242.1 hypothetical protein PHYSODRAFT_516690 [Phytophthora sojae]|eukprot:XP_009532575.1 hypothetical protein PHYSODRAFT_516690 [Phytophthora sojae]
MGKKSARSISFQFTAIPRSQKRFSKPYVAMTTQENGPAKLLSLQQRFRDIHLVIIDGFSVISCGMLYWIDQRMREIWPDQREVRFGGRDAIFTGDSAQLDPVTPYSLATSTDRIRDNIQRKGREIWEEIKCVCSLSSQHRPGMV